MTPVVPAQGAVPTSKLPLTMRSPPGGGVVPTVRVAFELVALVGDVAESVTLTAKTAPLSLACAVRLYVAEVAPAIATPPRVH